MATNPVPQPLTTTQLLNDLHTEFAGLAHKHATVSFLTLGVLAFVIALASFGGWLGLKEIRAQSARADAQNALYVSALKDFQTTIAQHDAARAVAEAKVEQLTVQIAQRATKPLPAPVQAGLNPNADAKTAASALASVYSDTPQFGAPEPTPDGKVSSTVQETQLLIESKVKLDRLTLDFQDEKQVVDLQTGSISSLNNDLTQCKDTLTSANKTIADYRVVVKPSRWQRFKSGAKIAVKVSAVALPVGILIGKILL
jgi:hypothetical protein